MNCTKIILLANYPFNFEREKPVFGGNFDVFSTKPEVEFSNLYILQTITIDLENTSFKF